MPAVTGVWVMRDGEVTLEGTDYTNQVRKARLVPSFEMQQYRTLVPDGAIADVGNPTWVLELAGVQKHTAGGLAKALNDATPGTALTLSLVPKNGVGNANATAEVIAVPVEFGGEEGQFPTFDITLPVIGEPTFGVES